MAPKVKAPICVVLLLLGVPNCVGGAAPNLKGVEGWGEAALPKVNVPEEEEELTAGAELPKVLTAGTAVGAKV